MQAHKRAYTFARMSTLADRIKQARKHAGLTQRELAKLVGVSQPVISQLESGENLQSVHLVKIASACRVSAHWLSAGSGQMAYGETWGMFGTAADDVTGDPAQDSALSAVKAMLANSGKGLPESVRQRLLAAAEEAEAPEPFTGNVITADFSRRPVVGDEIRIAHYDVVGAMGGGKVVHDYPEMFRDVTVSQRHLRELGVTYKDPAHLKLITGQGQSMAPMIQDMDPLIVDASVREFMGDGVYAFTWHGHFYIKTLQMLDADHFRMLSANPAYPPQEIRIDETYIQSRVLLVWNARKL